MTQHQQVSFLLFYDKCCCICQLFHRAYIYTPVLILKFMLVNFIRQSSYKYFRFYFIVCWIHFNVFITPPRLHWSIVKLATLFYLSLVWFMTRFIQDSLESMSDCNTIFVVQKNNPNAYFVNFSNKQWESDSHVAFAYLMHVCKSSIPNVISIRCV